MDSHKFRFINLFQPKEVIEFQFEFRWNSAVVASTLGKAGDKLLGFNVSGDDVPLGLVFSLLANIFL